MAPHTFSSLDVYTHTETVIRNSTGQIQQVDALRLSVKTLDQLFLFQQISDAHLSYRTTLYLDFQDATKGHAEVPVVVFAKHSLEGLFEQGGIEGVSHHDVAPVSTSQEILYSVQQKWGWMCKDLHTVSLTVNIR